MENTGVWLIVVFSHIALSCTASPVTLDTVEWKYSRRLYDYKTYGSISLERIELPLHTIFVNLTFNAFSNDDSCDIRKVNIYSNQYGIPVVRRDKEVFPTDTHTPESMPNMTISTNNKTQEWIQSNLDEGSVFVMAVMPHDDTRIRQKGLYAECVYSMSIRAIISYYSEGTVPLIPVVTGTGLQKYNLEGPVKMLTSFKVLPDTLSYEISIDGCQEEPCDINVYQWDSLSPGMWNKTDLACSWNEKSCIVQKSSPHVGTFSYVGLDLTSKRNEAISVSLRLNSCTERNEMMTAGWSDSNLEDKLPTTVQLLGRETPSDASSGSNFKDHFTLWDRNVDRPSKMISLEVPDNTSTVVRFTLRSSDTGATLNLKLEKPKEVTTDSDTKQNVEVTLCASLSKIILSTNCSDGVSMKMNSTFKKANSNLMVPYPQTGIWYITMQTRCYEGNKDSFVKCTQTPRVNLTVHLSSCGDNDCGDYGSCKLYSSADIVYTACNCFGGWRGYTCNDGSEASSLADQRVAVYLLTFSNLGFIPGIGLALYRRYYVEAFVYTYNMFFSTFYHACDGSNVYKLCILPFEALSFSDFFASLMSFSVTLLAMARIPINLRTFLHVVAAMFIALGEVYNRHGLFEQLVPIASGLGIVAISWGYQMYKRKKIFPSKWRYLKFILPGLSLAVLGMILNLEVETDGNYKYVHSMWHILVAGAIIFLLPPRRGKKSEAPLSIRSGDVTASHQSLFSGETASLQNAGDIENMSEQTALQSVRDVRLTNRNHRGQNYVL